MSIYNIYSSGYKKRNREHVAAIVQIAQADGTVTDEEQKFLDRMAINLEIEENIKNLFREEEAAEEAADEELNEIIEEAEEVAGNLELDAEAKETGDVENTDVTVEINSGEVSENTAIETPDDTQEPETRGQS